VRRYEAIVIVPADFTEDEVNALIDRYQTIIAKYKGLIIKTEKWGKRKLAYEIKKQGRGFYILIEFASLSDLVVELERNFKIDDKILKFMTVKKDDQVDPAAIEKEIEDAKAPAAMIETPQQAATTPGSDPIQIQPQPEASTATTITEGGE
jgi:small subunit ribosomal protein S6